MSTRQKQVGKFLLPAVVLALAAIFVFPMQQAMASGGSCGGSCDGNGGSKCCGSLVNVQGNNVGNVKTGDVKVGNVKTGDILSGNKIKVLNNNDILSHNKLKIKDTNVLSKNYVKDINVLSKNSNNKFLNYVLSDNPIKIKVLNDNFNTEKSFNILSNNYKKGCGC